MTKRRLTDWEIIYESFHLNPESGEWLPDNTHRQRHFNAAIAFNLCQCLLTSQKGAPAADEPLTEQMEALR